MRWLGAEGLPVLRLLTDVTQLEPPGHLVAQDRHEHVGEAEVSRYAIDAGTVLLTVWREVLHEVIYQLQPPTRQASESQRDWLLTAYGDGLLFNEILDNGWGKTYRREDMERFALWSYAADVTTVGTMSFHAVKWGEPSR